MPALDFKEIVPRGRADGTSSILRPGVFGARGLRRRRRARPWPDGGRDLVVEEARQGPGGRTDVRWLVSCKHKAHPGQLRHARRGVDNPGPDRYARLHGLHRLLLDPCPEQRSAPNLAALKPQFECLVYDQERVERRLLETPGGLQLARRFMPRSFARCALRARSGDGLPGRTLPKEQLLLAGAAHRILPRRSGRRVTGNSPVFCVIFDPAHPTRSKLNLTPWATSWSTRRPSVSWTSTSSPWSGPSSAPELSRLIPDDDPLELCLWVVLDPSARILPARGRLREPQRGLEAAAEVIRQSEASP